MQADRWLGPSWPWKGRSTRHFIWCTLKIWRRVIPICIPRVPLGGLSRLESGGTCGPFEKVPFWLAAASPSLRRILAKFALNAPFKISSTASNLPIHKTLHPMHFEDLTARYTYLYTAGSLGGLSRLQSRGHMRHIWKGSFLVSCCFSFPAPDPGQVCFECALQNFLDCFQRALHEFLAFTDTGLRFPLMGPWSLHPCWAHHVYTGQENRHILPVGSEALAARLIPANVPYYHAIPPQVDSKALGEIARLLAGGWTVLQSVMLESRTINPL